MCESDIKDACPNCHREFAWNACHDCYCGAKEVETVVKHDGHEIAITLYLCPSCDDSVFAVQVLDGYGGTVFIPSKAEL